MRITKAILVAVAAFAFCAMTAAAQQQVNGLPVLHITNPPTAQNVTGDSATIVWDTNAEGSNEVLYGTDPNALQGLANPQSWPQEARPASGSTPGLAEVPWGGTHHSVNLTGLQPNTTYYFFARSMAGQGTGTGHMSQMGSFKTSPTAGGQSVLMITTPPTAQNVTSNSATIVWDTNAEGSNEVLYGTEQNAVQQLANPQSWPTDARPASGSTPGLA